MVWPPVGGPSWFLGHGKCRTHGTGPPVLGERETFFLRTDCSVRTSRGLDRESVDCWCFASHLWRVYFWRLVHGAVARMHSVQLVRVTTLPVRFCFLAPGYDSSIISKTLDRSAVSPQPPSCFLAVSSAPCHRRARHYRQFSREVPRDGCLALGISWSLPFVELYIFRLFRREGFPHMEPIAVCEPIAVRLIQYQFKYCLRFISCTKHVGENCIFVRTSGRSF